jgi:hypothetical protein
MEVGVALLLFALGAILAFAVRISSPILNLHVAGYVLMAISVVGIYLSRRRPTWVRRVIVVPRRRRLARVDEVDQAAYPPFVQENPNAAPAGQVEVVQPGDTSVEKMVLEHLSDDT